MSKVVVEGVIRAAGGIVTRGNGEGLEVLVVHRPHRADWSFPKGHLHPGETDLEAARREVREETGLDVVERRDLGEVRYRVGDRPKAVRYWEMRPAERGARAGGVDVADGDGPDRRDVLAVSDGEVDEVRWVGPDEAADLLTYESDRTLLAGLLHP